MEAASGSSEMMSCSGLSREASPAWTQPQRGKKTKEHAYKLQMLFFNICYMLRMLLELDLAFQI